MMIHIVAFKDCPACIPILEAEYEVSEEALDHLKETMGQKYFNCIITIRNRIVEHRDLHLKHLMGSDMVPFQLLQLACLHYLGFAGRHFRNRVPKPFFACREESPNSFAVLDQANKEDNDI
ncbi:hypothetical protein RHGRI_025927 [Rhododendron griersonianum]|uniref:Uncharacterized protein n=1 Tax=Rhododendron griersonianum TaxID=479676 RepID=A0AAV6IWE9_9ERIC|nr:hypothetical protein RHGRI_025927 [Rhododendron griersonianum]